LSKVLKDGEAPYDEVIKPLLRQLGALSSEGITATGFVKIEAAYRSIWKDVLARPEFQENAADWLHEAHALQKRIEAAVKKPIVVVHFNGNGPSLTREGEYNEIARIIPKSSRDAQPGVLEQRFDIDAPCGASNKKGSLTFVLCSNKHHSDEFTQSVSSLRLWSSSFQATTTVGRKFDRILKGRAQFRMSTEIAALIGGAVALQLLNASLSMQGQQAANMQTAALVVGAVAATAWLAGRATNPEADIRQVVYNFESGYLAVF
jgi:hypothetical protein